MGITMNKREFVDLMQSYQGISEILRNCTYDEIIEIVSQIKEIKPENLERMPMGGYSKGRMSGAYAFVLKDMLLHTGYYDRVYSMLYDERSKEVFTRLMQFRLVPDPVYIRNAYDGTYAQYFDHTIVSCSQDEVFVDCGGFIGDTAEAYIRECGEYKRIYVYEPSSDNIETCMDNLKKYRDITVKRCGVGEKNEWLSMDTSQSSSSFVNADHNQEMVEIISLDQDIEEPVTYIKMDIEGFEIPAILGAKNHIRKEHPKLAVCTYHIISDLWEIPLLIHEIYPAYRFYLRHYMEDQNWETVLYAIPEEEGFKAGGEMIQAAGAKRIVAMAPYDRGWSNVELVKDCGIIPYLLYKNHGHIVSMTGARGGTYPYHELYTKGIEMEFLDDGGVQGKIRYIEEHAKEIDGLLLRGCYESNFGVAVRYKQQNPDGKIYVGLDANSWWMDRIMWDKQEFVEFMDSCDVIATSCRAMQEHLNQKWPWKIEHIPNGYYDFTHTWKTPVFSEKNNVILTVGRLGTNQKATEILLEAFAAIADRIPEWKMRLVGNVEEAFESYKTEYFRRFPNLCGRIEFTGPIIEREKLLAEYEKAKVFALPSRLEGGTPNVVAEALHGGCVIAAAEFDAYEEAIDQGRCGRAARIGNAKEFGKALYELCTCNELEQFSSHACEYAKRHFDMEKITARVNELLFGGRL